MRKEWLNHGICGHLFGECTWSVIYRQLSVTFQSTVELPGLSLLSVLDIAMDLKCGPCIPRPRMERFALWRCLISFWNESQKINSCTRSCVAYNRWKENSLPGKIAKNTCSLTITAFNFVVLEFYFFLQDYSWEEHGFSLVNRYYPDIATLLDNKLSLTSNLTYNTWVFMINNCCRNLEICYLCWKKFYF